MASGRSMEVFVISKTALLFALFLESANGQSPENCRKGSCVTPRTCVSGYYQQKQWMTVPFPYCCYTVFNGYKSTYTSQSESLKQLDCRFRNVRSFARTDIDKDVKVLDLSFNKLHRKAPYVRDIFLEHLLELRALTITTSLLDFVPSNFLRQNRGLEHLDLSINSLRELPDDLFAHTPELVKVDFSWNQISVLPKNLFKHTPGIQEIQLDHNRLKFLTSDNFTFTPALEYLDVSANPTLECVSASFLRHTPKVTYVGLENTGYILPSPVRRVFCSYNNCHLSIAKLKWLLTIYRSPRSFRRMYRPRGQGRDHCEESRINATNDLSNDF